MSHLVDQILQEPGVDVSEFSRHYDGETLEQRVSFALDELLDKPDMVEHLDNLHDIDLDRFFKIKSGISELPGTVIEKYFGIDMLITVAANAALESTAQRLKAHMETQLGIDPILFEKARLWEWQNRGYNSKGKDVIAQYRALEYVMTDAVNDINLQTLLENNAKDGVVLSESRMSDYELLPMVSVERFASPDGPAKGWYYLEDNTDEVYGIWLDAPVAMSLVYKGRPQAIIGVASNGPDELKIHQLQGVRAKRVDRTKNLYNDECVIGRVSARGLAPLQWQELMIGIGEQIAAGLGKKTLGIQAGEHNKWTKITLPRETEPHVSLDRAIEAYDVPAQRNGFERTETGDWSRPLRSIGRVAVAS